MEPVALGPALAGCLEGLADLGREPGGAVSVVRGGEVLAEASTGTTDGSRPWTPDTLVMAYSVAKPLAALAVLSVVAEGRLGLDQPVAQVWPEFAAHRKQTVTVRHVLSHQAGLPTFPPAALDIAFDDRERLQQVLADAVPETAPGTAVAEHALTYGHLCDALTRRATGEGVDERFARLAARNGWDAHLRLGVDDLHRAADVVPVDGDWPTHYLEDPRWGPALGRPVGLLDPSVLNSDRWRRCPFPAINVHASARGIATFYADLIDPDGAVGREIGLTLREEFLGAQATGTDRVLDRPVTWTLGLQLDPGEVGMGGAGGCAAWGSLRSGHGAAYLTRGLGGHDRGDAVHDIVEDAMRPSPGSGPPAPSGA